MKASLRYAATGFLALGAVILALWWFLPPEGRRGVLLAAAIALVVQVVAFSALVRFRTPFHRLLLAWAGGTVLRLAVVLVVAFLAVRSQLEGVAPMLLALAGFLFLLLLLEPLYLRLELTETVEAR